MKSALIGLAVTSVVIGSTAGAQELVGSSLDLGYSGFTEQVPTPDGNKRPGQVFLGYSAEIGITSQFSVQGDVAYRRYNVVEDNAFNIGLHAILHASDAGSVGLFLGHEEILGLGVDYYGIEGGLESGTFAMEAYFSQVSSEGETANLYGISGGFDIGSGIGLGLGFDRLDDGGAESISRLALSTRYEVQDGATVFAEIGSVNVDTGGFLGLGSASETFFGVGVEYTFGAARGATFDRRGLSDLFPGL
jgi:hypothetical protein